MNRDSEILIEESLEQINKKPNPIWEWTKSILIAVVIAIIIRVFLFQPTRVQGESMIHTLENDDRIILNKISMKISPLKRGNIVVLRYDKNQDYVKRIIGLPGENIQIIDGKVYINGELYEEDYMTGDYTDTINGFEWKLEEDEYFVLGDNRQPGGSTDSRVFGPVHVNSIKGTVRFRYFPFNSFGVLK